MRSSFLDVSASDARLAAEAADRTIRSGHGLVGETASVVVRVGTQSETIRIGCGRHIAFARPLMPSHERTLVHGDFHADNVIISAHDASPVIIDWTDGVRSHPFFDLLTLLRGRTAKRVAAQREALVHAYLREWSEAGVGAVDDLHEVFTVAQRLAPSITRKATAAFSVSAPPP